MTKKLIIAATPLILGIAALSFAARSEVAAERPASKAPPVQVLGEPVDCIDISRIRNRVVHDDYTIDFQLSRGDIYRNTLPNRCSQLGVEKRIAYEASIGRLCSVETISVIQTGAAGPGTRCSLGKFVPVRYVEAAGD
jgi:hypothetical protein